MSFGALVLQEGFGGDVTSEGYAPILALLAVSYFAGRCTSGRRTVLAGCVLLGLTWASVPFGDDPDLASMVLSLVITGIISLGPWLAGAAIRDREDRVRRLTELNEALDRERDERVRVSLQLERAHIARELHDVLAHSVTVMVVHAEAADELITRSPEQAAESLQRIQQCGRAALEETRRVLASLRDHHPHRLDDLDDLVAAARATGIDVRLQVKGTPRVLPPVAGMSAYRIVQEALTNVRKHTDAHRVDIVLCYREDGLSIEVIDDGAPQAPRPESGFGLRGMRERAQLHGGELQAGARAGKGFAVTAWLPLAAAEE